MEHQMLSQSHFEDQNVLHTTEVRFMESTENLRKYYFGGRVQPAARSKMNKSQNQGHLESVSTEKSHGFKSQNIAKPSELIDSYLPSYSPNAMFHIPANTFNQSCYQENCDGFAAWQHHAMSQHRLLTTIALPKIELPTKHISPLVMQDTGDKIVKADKKVCSSLNLCMQRIVEVFQEERRKQRVCEKPLLLEQRTYYVKHPVLEPGTVSQPQEKSECMVEPVAARQPPGKANTDMTTFLSNCLRAYYDPTPGAIPPLKNSLISSSVEPQKHPPAQFQLISSNPVSNELVVAKTRHLSGIPIKAPELKLPRAPLQCPNSCCQRIVFVSDFTKHMVIDHVMPLERVSIQQHKNFFLESKQVHYGETKSHMLYLMCDKVTKLGSGEFQDYLPLMVMATRIQLPYLCVGRKENPQTSLIPGRDKEFIMIWLTSIVPEDMPVCASLTVWSRSGSVPRCHKVHSVELISLRKSQRTLDVLESGQTLLLSEDEVQQLTTGNKQMIELQLLVH